MSTSVEEFARNLSRQPWLIPLICVAADKSTTRVFDATPDREYVTSPGRTAVRTNHNLVPELRHVAPTLDEYPSTHHRYQRATQLLNKHTDWTFEGLAGLAADHDGYPQSSICRHPGPDGKSQTLYSVTMRINDGVALALLGNPCESAGALSDGPRPDLSDGSVVIVEGHSGTRLSAIPHAP
ncbi:hypothetical protein GCM10022419_124390 [Nonomuraea rosea]|uniref:Peptidase C45 hydrolase domain-containing protein n=1 Tax=Nonomuraea rosea TaxID=638574 RepID=A0ABP6ZRL4_9ACTN